MTESDRVLLQNLRKLVIPRIEAGGGWGSAVHFWVGDGAVTMVGTVPTKEARSEAEEMVAQLSGVNSVQNKLFVGTIDPNANETDQELVYRLRETVLPQVTSGRTSPVDFSVRDGQVTLVGRASSPEDAARIQKLVQQVPGVASIKNELLLGNSADQNNLTPTGRGTTTPDTQPQTEPIQPAPNSGNSTTPPPTPQPQK